MLLIKNTSAIPTSLKTSVKNFQLSPCESKLPQNRGGTINTELNNRKISDRYCLAQPNSGIGFGVEYATMDLPAFAQITCPVYVLAEIWGTYDDLLVVNVDGVAFEHVIPLVCEVAGAPIRLYTGKVIDNESSGSRGDGGGGSIGDDEISIIRFGSQMQGKESSLRKLQIQNTCRIPIEIEWKIFLTDSNDTQLIDLNLVYNDVETQSDANSSTSCTQRGIF
jgi:hypothetical protein